MHTQRFGKHPKGERLLKIKQSPNYKKGSFQNLNKTPMLTEGIGYGKVLFDFLFFKIIGLDPFYACCQWVSYPENGDIIKLSISLIS